MQCLGPEWLRMYVGMLMLAMVVCFPKQRLRTLKGPLRIFLQGRYVRKWSPGSQVRGADPLLPDPLLPGVSRAST